MDAPFRRFFKELGIPVQMLNDREKVNRCTSQVGVHSVVRGGNTFKKWYGYGSIPISTIFRGMNIHKSQLFWCEQKGYKGFDPSPYDTGEIWMGCFLMVADSVWRWLMLIMWMCVHSVSSHIWEPFDWRSFQKPRFGNHGWSTSIGFLVSIRLDFPSIFQSFRFSDTHHLYPLVN